MTVKDYQDAWQTVMLWTDECRNEWGISSEKISELWEKYKVVKYMLDNWDLYQTGDKWVDDVREYILEQGGSV